MSTEVEANTKREHKKSKKKEEDDGGATSVSKSKKKKNEEKDMVAESNEYFKSSEEQEKKWKRKHSEADDIIDDAAKKPDSYDLTEKKWSKRRKGEVLSSASTNEVGAVDEPEDRKSKKKSKKRKSDAVQKDEEGSDVDLARRKTKDEQKKAKKKRKKVDNETSHLNPSEDETLTDKARAALSYTSTRITSPDSWKFSKAHQNWIVKHFFALNDIPKKYIPTVVDYLEGCQGGVRKKLVQSCKAQLETSVPGSESPATRVSSEATSNRQSEITVGPAPTGSTSLTSEKSTLSPEIHEAVKARAKLLLKALGNESS